MRRFGRSRLFTRHPTCNKSFDLDEVGLDRWLEEVELNELHNRTHGNDCNSCQFSFFLRSFLDDEGCMCFGSEGADADTNECNEIYTLIVV